MAEPNGVHQSSAHPIYEELHQTKEFTELRRTYRAFVIPCTVGFLAWYLLYVVMSNWATDFMSQKVVGNINVALVFGLLQFVTTFLLAYVYSGFANKRLDPLARELNDDYNANRRGGDAA